MKNFKTKIFIFLIVATIIACSKDTNQTNNQNNVKVELRSSSNQSDFYNLNYLNEELDLGADTSSYFPFTISTINELESSNSLFFNSLGEENIYPCWNCSELEFIGFENYYTPFYDKNSAELKSLLISQRRSQEADIDYYYFTRSLLDQMSAREESDFTGYWNDIFNYFDGGINDKNRQEHFTMPATGCKVMTWTNTGCRCEAHSEINPADCTIWDISDDPDDIPSWNSMSHCDGPDGGNDDNDSDGDGDPDDGPNPFRDISAILLFGANGYDYRGGPIPDDNRLAEWNERCSSFDGSLDFVMTEDGEFVDPRTNTLLLTDPRTLYLNQMDEFIQQYSLNITPQELVVLVGEKCAVNNLKDVHDCVKCHFISPINTDGDGKWYLNQVFSTLILTRNPNDIADALNWTIRYNVSQSQLDCIFSNPAVFDAINELDNNDTSFPCDDRTQNEVIAEIISSLGENCNTSSFDEANDAEDKIILPLNFKTDCPCFNNIINTLKGGDPNNWLCEVFIAVEDSKGWTQEFEVYDVNNPPQKVIDKINQTGNSTPFFNSREGIGSGTIFIPDSYCNNQDNVGIEIASVFIHEMMHGYINSLMADAFPNGLPSDFFIDAPSSSVPGVKVMNIDKYWSEITGEYISQDPNSTHQHNTFFEDFLDPIMEALWQLNGSNPNHSIEDYAYFAHLIVNTKGLLYFSNGNLRPASTLPSWVYNLGIIDENNNILFNLDTHKNHWDSKIGDSTNFSIDCSE